MFFYTPDWSDGTIRRFVRRVGGPEGLADLFALREGDVRGRGFGEDPDAEIGELRRRIGEVASADAALRVTDLKLNGRDVMEILGTPPGRHIGVILERLLDRVLDDPSLNQRDKLAALVPEIATEMAADVSGQPAPPPGRRPN
jgi:hypothetical protein